MHTRQDQMRTAFEKGMKEQGLWEAGFATLKEKGVSWFLWEGVLSFFVQFRLLAEN